MREALINFYTEDRDNQALRRVFEIATGHGLVSLVIEPRYIDIDWTSGALGVLLHDVRSVSVRSLCTAFTSSAGR